MISSAAWRTGGRAWMLSSTTLLLIVLSVIALGLRLYDLDANGLSLDEVVSVWLAGRSAADIVLGILIGGADPTPPIYYLLLHGSLQLGGDVLFVRAPSILAGVLSVWLTFRLAADLFDRRVAALAAFLVAVAPLQIAVSRTARGYSLAALFALAAVYFLARILFVADRRREWVGLVVMTIAALYTHYLMFLFLLFANLVILARPRLLRRWLLAQGAIVLTLLPAVYSVLSVRSESQAWLGRPDGIALVKGLILMVTGNPSYGYGATGATPARVLALGTVAAIFMLGVWALRSAPSAEVRRVLYLAAAFLIPWLAAFAIGQVRPLYAEKYILFVAPPLAITFAWALLRTRSVLAPVALAALLGLTGQALAVYYTQPYSDQFREAVGVVREAAQPDDLIVISPAFFGRPFAYFFYTGTIPDGAAVHRRAPAIQARGGHLEPFDPAALAGARRVWLLEGGADAPADPAVVRSLEERFDPTDGPPLVGATVRLWERAE